ncbi:ATP-binding protein [Streptomyces sp. S1]|uniref:ATP-binding protein n=1 Tax=Streptomyces sp. S1 TaxID=718288 RepID=UPI003D754D3D
MNVQSSGAALQPPERDLGATAHGLMKSDQGAPIETASTSHRKSAFEAVMTYSAEAKEVSRGRHQIHELMVATGLSEIADSVALGATELMANALAHGCRKKMAQSFTVKVTYSNGRVRVGVQDPSSIWPFQRPPSNESEGGRGLLLIDALATNWGITPGPGTGKTVWMELEILSEGDSR